MVLVRGENQGVPNSCHFLLAIFPLHWLSWVLCKCKSTWVFQKEEVSICSWPFCGHLLSFCFLSLLWLWGFAVDYIREWTWLKTIPQKQSGAAGTGSCDTSGMVVLVQSFLIANLSFLENVSSASSSWSYLPNWVSLPSLFLDKNKIRISLYTSWMMRSLVTTAGCFSPT